MPPQSTECKPGGRICSRHGSPRNRVFTGTNAIIAAAVLSISALDAAVDFDFLWTREADFGTPKGLLLRDVYASSLFFFFAPRAGRCMSGLKVRSCGSFVVAEL